VAKVELGRAELVERRLELVRLLSVEVVEEERHRARRLHAGRRLRLDEGPHVSSAHFTAITRSTHALGWQRTSISSE
jgi:hypothetical protein